MPLPANDLIAVTSEFPPFNYTENGQVKGICTDIIRLISEDIGMQTDIQVFPWARAYHMAQSSKNILIFTIARTPERESLFKWGGILVSGKTYLFGLKSRSGLVVNSMKEASPYSIGVVRNGIRSRYLKQYDFLSIQEVSRSDLNALKLVSGRIDLWAEEEYSAYFILKKQGYNPEEMLSRVYDLNLSLDGYMAFSSDVDDRLVDSFRLSLAKFRMNGTVDTILDRYR